MRLLLLTIAVVLVASACSSTAESSESAASASTVGESVSESPAALVPPETDEVDDTDIEAAQPEADRVDAEDAPAESDITGCTAPALQAHFVDVEIDDPDGGLNLREAAGASSELLATVVRGSELIPTGECEIVGSTDWWQVTNSDGSLIGWVSSLFLSETIVLNPGLGRLMPDVDNVGITAETIEGLAAQLAIIYGFNADLTITQIGDLEGIDASSGSATYDLTGLQDDSSNGYRVQILFFIERDPTGDEVLGFSASRIDRQPLCSRGVADDGLCV